MGDMMESLFGFEASRAQQEVRAFYGPAYEAIKQYEAKMRDLEKMKCETAHNRLDEIAHQIKSD